MGHSAQRLAPFMTLALADSIAALRRASLTQNPARKFLDYADGVAASDRDVETHEQLWSDMIEAVGMGKSVSDVREALLMIDDNFYRQLTRSEDIRWRYAWATDEAEVFCKMWLHVRRRCEPNWEVVEDIQQQVGPCGESVNRLRKFWVEVLQKYFHPSHDS